MAADEKPPTPSPPPPGRLPYETPAVVSEEIFETLAAACGKAGGFKCQANGGLRS